MQLKLSNCCCDPPAYTTYCILAISLLSRKFSWQFKKGEEEDDGEDEEALFISKILVLTNIIGQTILRYVRMSPLLYFSVYDVGTTWTAI